MSNNRQRRRQSNSTVEPSNVNGLITARTEFYRTELHSMIKGMFKIKCPDEWEQDYMLNLLLTKGYILLSDTVAGTIPVKGSLSGFNYWDYPTKATIDMPTIGSFDRTLHKDCEVVFLERTRTRAFYNFNKLIDVYAYKLAAADAGIDVNLMNTRVAYMAEAESKAQAETIKRMYDEVTSGEPIVVYRSDALSQKGLQLFFGNVKQNYVADSIQDSKRTIMNEFLTRLGINNANTDKKERLIVNEVDANNVELQCNVALWKKNLKVCVKRVKKIFPDIEFNIKLRFDPKKLAEKASSTVEQNPLGGNKNDTVGNERSMGDKERK